MHRVTLARVHLAMPAGGRQVTLVELSKGSFDSKHNTLTYTVREMPLKHAFGNAIKEAKAALCEWD